MGNIKIRALILSPILIFIPLILHSMDPSSFMIKLKGFSTEIYFNKTSRYTLESSDLNFSIIGNCFQEVLDSHSVGDKKIIEIRSGIRVDSCGGVPGKEDLLDTMFLNLSSATIMELASRFRGEKNAPSEIENFVFSHITKKIIGIPLLPAAKIAVDRTGDCTEHAVLAISLLRSLGIPSRAVVGVYLAENFGGQKNVFVYHMWAEAYDKGIWYLIDATSPGPKQFNRYIAFTHHSLKTEMPLAFLKAISAIRNMEIRYLGR